MTVNRDLFNIRNLNPTKSHEETIKKVIDKFKSKDLIDKKIAGSLIPHKAKPPRYYILPKIHKANNSGRPVISSLPLHTSETSRFIDHHLQPKVKEIKPCVKDTTDFINSITSQLNIPGNSFLVSMKV